MTTEKATPKPREFAKPIDDFSQREVMIVQNHLTQLRQATTKAQLDFSQCLMLEPGATQTALMGEILGYMADAHAHFKKLSDLILKK